MAYTNEKLAVLGGRFSTRRMMEQIPVSVAVAREHAEALGVRFPVSKVDELEGYGGRIGELFDEQTEHKFLAATGNVEVGARIHLLKERTRTIIAVADNTFEEEPEVRKQFHKEGPFGKSVSGIVQKAASVIALATQHAERLAEWGLTEEDLAGAQGELNAVVAANTAQEQALTDLPPTTRELYEIKGRAYLLLKKLGRVARRVFADDPAVAARFGLDILRRQGTAAPVDPSESQ